MSEKHRQYTNNEVTVLWKPEQCIHSKVCWTHLREVFDPFKRPWVNIEGATTDKIVEQVKRCPSGALSYYMNTAEPQAAEDTALQEPAQEAAAAHATEVAVSLNGPYLINTQCMIKYPDGREELKQGTVALCRCGASNNKPYCDGRHKQINFVG
ncbi:(4Fe-4S)-binding protein [Paraflavitalea pollutisoli]|uniref:(4Fe-4S)-binding protein n=1 Tax=Paraflavitalea pollutisoli TaxID=3034143 RepID=UPI0023EDF4D7|nr:(4Fe-4S)-binding protein [Paraflavitalea sp. H1-2-19X]